MSRPPLSLAAGPLQGPGPSSDWLDLGERGLRLPEYDLGERGITGEKVCKDAMTAMRQGCAATSKAPRSHAMHKRQRVQCSQDAAVGDHDLEDVTGTQCDASATPTTDTDLHSLTLAYRAPQVRAATEAANGYLVMHEWLQWLHHSNAFEDFLLGYSVITICSCLFTLLHAYAQESILQAARKLSEQKLALATTHAAIATDAATAAAPPLGIVDGIVSMCNSTDVNFASVNDSKNDEQIDICCSMWVHPDNMTGSTEHSNRKTPNTSATNSIQGVMANCDRHKVPKILHRAASLVHVLASLVTRKFVHVVETALSEGWSAKSLLISFAYDETPMSLRVDGLVMRVDTDGNVHVTDRKAAVAGQQAKDNIARKQTVSKVLQTQITMVALLCREDRYWSIEFHHPPSVQVMDYATADNLVQCLMCTLEKYSQWKTLCNKFPVVCHVSLVDRGSANLKAERYMQQQRKRDEVSQKMLYSSQPHFLHTRYLHILGLCGAHRTATTNGSFMANLPMWVSGVISFGLTQRASGALDLLRLCISVCQLVRVKVRHCAQVPTHRKHADYRDSCLELFLPGQEDQERVVRIRNMYTGKLRKASLIHWCTPTCCNSDDECKVKLLNLTMDLLPTLTPVFARHRWTGSEKAMRSAGLLCTFLPMDRILVVWIKCLRSHSTGRQSDKKPPNWPRS